LNKSSSKLRNLSNETNLPEILLRVIARFSTGRGIYFELPKVSNYRDSRLIRTVFKSITPTAVEWILNPRSKIAVWRLSRKRETGRFRRGLCNIGRCDGDWRTQAKTYLHRMHSCVIIGLEEYARRRRTVIKTRAAIASSR